jgi:hypothetical protein
MASALFVVPGFQPGRSSALAGLGGYCRGAVPGLAARAITFRAYGPWEFSEPKGELSLFIQQIRLLWTGEPGNCSTCSSSVAVHLKA